MGRQQRRRRGGKRLDLETARIAIIGSGLSGLSCALQIQANENSNNAAAGWSKSCNVKIYERDDSLQARKEGYGLTLTYHPTGILNTLGVLNDISDVDCPSRSHYLLNASGHIQGYFGNAFSGGGYGQRGNLRVPRQVVRQILASRLQDDSIHWNHKLVDMQPVVENGTATAVRLTFENGVTVIADLVIAADGIRSTVVQTWLPEAPPPQSLNVRIILGLTQQHQPDGNNYHQLLHERGFYTLSPGMRLFVMPYTGSALGRSLDPTTPVRFMWQLSFSDNDNTCYTSAQLQAEALARTTGWHAPVQELIQSTPVTSIWGTLLQDRDPVVLQQHLLTKHGVCPRVIVIGDALHAMSPFKGQGANQCLRDGAVIAKWLLHSKASSVAAIVQGCMREMVQRTAPVVRASRVAAAHWHSLEATTAVRHPFAGVDRDEDVDRLLEELQRRSINAGKIREPLDDFVRFVLIEIGIHRCDEAANVDGETRKVVVDLAFAEQAIEAAATGTTGTLRKLSWEHPQWIRLVVVSGETCLHVAAAKGHVSTVHWLITEAGCDAMTVKDENGQTVWDVATRSSNYCAPVRDLLLRLQASYLPNESATQNTLCTCSRVTS